MRLLSIFIIALWFAPSVQAQSDDDLIGWFIDDFSSTTFDKHWKEISGNWGLDGENLVARVPSGSAALMNDTYIMRTKPYVIDALIDGAGGGVMFCLDQPDKIRDGHLVYLTGSNVSMGYIDHVGEYIETRSVAYVMPERQAVQLRVQIDPANHRYTVTIVNRDLAQEELRYRSGYFGAYAGENEVSFDYFQVLAYDRADTPNLFLKSNKTQIDKVSYIGTLGDALLVANPIVGVVQRITSRGNFVSEFFVQGLNSEPRGMHANAQRWVYIVDGGQNVVRVYNQNEQMELLFSEGLEDPRDIWVDETGSRICVLDINAIRVFNKKGKLVDTKATGLFQDPKSMSHANGKFYVADHGNARVVVLDDNSFQVVDEIKENLVNPWGVFVDEATGEIFVADPGAGAVFQFDKNKNLLERMDPVTIRGFISPRSVQVINEYIYVADFERILVFTKGVLSVRPTFKLEM